MADDIGSSFSELSSRDKTVFLALAIHMATINGRGSYGSVRYYPESRLQEINEFIHRVAGYIPRILNGINNAEQDVSVMAMIVDHFRAYDQEYLLAKWLEISRST